MGLFDAISNWTNARYQKQIARMKELGKCPDCSGRGVSMLSYEHFSNTYNCPGCNGSGLFEDWMK